MLLCIVDIAANIRSSTLTNYCRPPPKLFLAAFIQCVCFCDHGCYWLTNNCSFTSPPQKNCVVNFIQPRVRSSTSLSTFLSWDQTFTETLVYWGRDTLLFELSEWRREDRSIADICPSDYVMKRRWIDVWKIAEESFFLSRGVGSLLT